MSADHSEEVPHGHAFDSPEEVAHAKEHALQNIGWFIGFFCLVLLAVANYEFSGLQYWWVIFGLAAARVLLIAFFMNWLFRSFSLVFRTICFTVFFLGGMVLLSLWDSTIKPLGNPIALPAKYDEVKEQPATQP